MKTKAFYLTGCCKAKDKKLPSIANAKARISSGVQPKFYPIKEASAKTKIIIAI